MGLVSGQIAACKGLEGRQVVRYLRVVPAGAGAWVGVGLLPSRWTFPGGTEKSRPLAANSLSE